jgi:hypothetical protein
MFCQPFRTVHGQDRLASASTAENTYWPRAVTDRQFLLDGVQEHPPLGQWRVHDGGQGLVVVHHDEAGLRFGGFDRAGKVLGVDRAIHLGFVCG